MEIQWHLYESEHGLKSVIQIIGMNISSKYNLYNTKEAKYITINMVP